MKLALVDSMAPGGQYGIKTQGKTDRCIAFTFLHQDVVSVKSVTTFGATVAFGQGQDRTRWRMKREACNACHDCEPGESNPGRLDYWRDGCRYYDQTCRWTKLKQFAGIMVEAQDCIVFNFYNLVDRIPSNM